MPDSTLKQIKPWVKAFSAEIPHKYKHGEIVCIGGLITKIVDLTHIYKDFERFIYVHIDDDVGECVVLIPFEIYNEIQKEYEIKEGEVVIVEGKVLDKKTDQGKPEVVCWNICPLSSKITKKGG